jgi:hypothetical protein
MTARANGQSDSARISVKVNPVNIAKGKPVSASSSQNDNTPAKANDGNPGTRWSSLDVDPQWITIDLEMTYNITEAKIIWEAAFAKEYTIDVSSDGSSWTTVYATKNGSGGTIVAPITATARYIRMNATQRNTKEKYWGYSIFEFEVYGTAAMPVSGDNYMDVGERSVYPTICRDHLTMTFPGTSDLNSLTVFDCSGKAVYTKNIDVNQLSVTVDTRTFVPGVYCITVYNNGKRMFTRRMIITHQ